jgi:hypothetical protein
MILNVSLCPYYNAVHISCQQKYKPQYPHKSVRIIINSCALSKGRNTDYSYKNGISAMLKETYHMTRQKAPL